jgi:phage baseplate assembly protein W
MQDSTNSYAIVYNEKAINNELLCALTTRLGRRLFNRSLGAGVLKVLFDPMDDSSVSRLKQAIQAVLNAFGSLIVVTGLTVLPDYPNQQYYIEIDYYIPALMNKATTLNFNLSKLT